MLNNNNKKLLLFDYDGTLVDSAQMIIDGTFEAFMIGETFHGIKMGKNVNTSTIGVSWGYNNQEELHRKMPTVL